MPFPSYSWPSADGRFVISTDPARLDFGAVHAYLSEQSYWAKGVTRQAVERAAAHSLCFGIYEVATNHQAGYARVVTDYTTFAYLCDVFVLETFRGHGLGKWLIATILSHPDIPNPRRWLLATADAHGLYAQNGFTPLPLPERWMVKLAQVAPPAEPPAESASHS